MRRSKARALELTPNEQQVVARLLQGESITAIARAMDRNISYVHRISKRPHVQALVNTNRGDLMLNQWQDMANLVPLWLARAKELLSIPVGAKPDPKLIAVQAAVGKDLMDRLGMVPRQGVTPANSPDQVAITFDAKHASNLLARLRGQPEETILDVQEQPTEGGREPPALPSGDADPNQPWEPGVPGGPDDD